MSRQNHLNTETQREAAYVALELMNAVGNEDRRRYFNRLMETLGITPAALADGQELFAEVRAYRQRKRALIRRQRAMARQAEGGQP